ncbi:hypothetical protein JRQ81_014073 [Phrynocephalus forsythii]|uniref:Uncharacterized protein n=1 Tax=Phrynocephalus forsythii TaxID=171643 RepID=A0A9Q0XW12_9SAUR|nr:hypothetical protein JRQ81_014073 [Phrynocephalus forsythii]
MEASPAERRRGSRGGRGDMSNKNSAESDTESECDFFSDCWEENIVHINKDLVDSQSERDLHFHQKNPSSFLGKEKGRSKLSETLLISNVTNFSDCCKHCPLLQAQILENAREFQVKLSPDSTLHLAFKDDSASSHALKTYLSKWDGSDEDDLFLNFKIPHTFATENSIKEQTFCTVNETYALNRRHHKPDEYLPIKKHSKPVQVFFPCKEAEAEEKMVSDSFKPSAGFVEINKRQAKKPPVGHSIESQLINDHLDCSSEDLYKTDSPHCSEQNCLHTASGDLVISLTLEAAWVDSASPLEGDSQRHTLAFKFKDSEENQLATKLYISLVPGSVRLDAEKPTRLTAFTKQRRCSQILDEDISHPLSGHTESSESSHFPTVQSSCSTFQSDQAPCRLKLWAPPQFFPSFKDTYASQTPTFHARSPHYKITSAYSSSQVQKVPPKASRPARSIVFDRNKKTQTDQQFRSKCPISKLHCLKAKNKNTHNTVEINDLYYVPLGQATNCCCSPLLDLTVDLYSAERDSEKLLRVHRKHPKRTRVGWAGGQNTHKSCKEEVFPTPNSSNMKGNDNFTLNKPTDAWNSTAPILSSTRNTSVPLSLPLSHSNERCSPSCLQTGRRSPAPLYLFCKEQNHSSIPCAQTERHIWHPAASYCDGKCSISHSPCCANIIQQQKERIYNAGVEKNDYDSNQVTCGCLFPKKLSVCSCGTMPQCGIFPKGYTSESVRKKTRADSGINWAAGMTESNRVNPPIGTCNTQEACCAKCHHGFPSCSLHNIGRQEDSKNHFIQVASFFENGMSTQNLKKDAVEKNKTLKTGDRKNVRFHVGPGITQETDLSGTYTVSSFNNGFQVPKHCGCHSEYPCCQHAIREHFDTSRSTCNCFGSELKNCLNRESIFLVKCGQGTRSHCQCSQEIPIFSSDQMDMCNGRRAAITEIKESEHIQDSSRVNHGLRRPYGNHKCCQDNIQKCCQYSYLQ